MRTNRRDKGAPSRRTPRKETFEEGRYLARLTASRMRVRVLMIDGSELEGVIEYYDRDVLRLETYEGPAVLIYKRDVCYLAELPDADSETT